MALKISLSFKSEEVEIYEFIKSKRNASCYLKDLVESDMGNKSCSVKKEIKPSNNSNDLELEF